MTLAEAAAMRVLLARIDKLEREVEDLKRRLDDKTTETLRLKKSG